MATGIGFSQPGRAGVDPRHPAGVRVSGRLVAGVDSSTQSVKVELRSIDDGRVVARSVVPHPPATPPCSEQDPAAWWGALVTAFGELGDPRERVVAIAVAGQQHGLVLIDDDGHVLRPAKLWNDTTSAPQAQRLVDALGADQWANRTGSVPVPSLTITKLAWVAEHEPEMLARTAKVMLPHDHLTWRLTGRHATDRGDASGTGWFHPSTDTVDSELLTLATGDAQPWLPRLPIVLGPTEPVGPISGDAAKMLGLPADVVVGPGTGDNMGGALGLGLASGDVAISLGTSGTAFVRSGQPTHDPSGVVAGFASASGDYLPLVCTLNATKITDRIADWLGIDAAGLGDLALAAADDPGTVTLLPYFDGERTPNLPDATGTIFGLTNQTTRSQLALAAHDSVLCGLLEGVAALRAVGAATGGRIFLIGGGARSAAYRRRCADLSAMPIVVPDAGEIVATGAAVQAAAVADGVALEDVTARWGTGTGTVIEPQVDADAVLLRYRAAARAPQTG